MIRYRAGMPGITDAELNSRDDMREAIKQERKVEFALEGLRYHDLRRWGDADAAYNTKIIGWNTKARVNNRILHPYNMGFRENPEACIYTEDVLLPHPTDNVGS